LDPNFYKTAVPTLDVPEKDNLAVVAHGFADDYFTPWWRPVNEKFQEWGYETAEIGFDGVLQTVDSPEKYAEHIQEQVDEKIDTLEEQYHPDEVVLIGHSMGGLTARYFVEEMGYEDRVDKMITFGTPHQGTRAAEPFAQLFEGAKDLSRNSEFSEKLNEDGVSDEIEYLSIYTADDPLVVPYENAELPEAENTENVEIGESFLKQAEAKTANFFELSAKMTSEIMQTQYTVWKDSMTDPLKLLNPGYWEELPAFDNPERRMMEVYSELQMDIEDVLTGHLTMLYNDETWREVADYLNEDLDDSLEEEFPQALIEDTAVSVKHGMEETSFAAD
jgi:triacylglycerol esterase/lipase EstA (alpha/beta hydrolase family)